MKFHGKVGFVTYDAIRPGVWKEVVTERECAGDLKRKNNRFVSGQQINDNLAINNQIEIIADPYINEHFPSIKYVEWKGTKWKVTSVEDQFPRLILTMGEVYNGQQT